MQFATPSSVAEILVAAGAAAAAVLTAVLVRARKEPPKTDDATAALAANTAAVRELIWLFSQMNGQFGDNNKMFISLTAIVSQMLEETRETRHAIEAARDHLSAMRGRR